MNWATVILAIVTFLSAIGWSFEYSSAIGRDQEAKGLKIVLEHRAKCDER